MLGEYVYEKSPAAYADHIWIDDAENLEQTAAYIAEFAKHGFEIVRYTDDLHFRIDYEAKVKAKCGKLVVLNTTSAYVPYDILNCFTRYAVSLRTLFPRLNTEVLRRKSKTELDLLSEVIGHNYDDLTRSGQTEAFFDTVVCGRENLRSHFKAMLNDILRRTSVELSCKDWFRIAEQKTLIDRYSVQHALDIDSGAINRKFQEYALRHFGELSNKLDHDSPILVSRAMDYMHEHSDKFAVIVMDGMSEFDWSIISGSFSDIPYEQSAMFAMIPSTTSVSRQCLLSGKFPSQLESAWNLSKEKQEFTKCATALGYRANQIAYVRGYDAEFDDCVRCSAVIINDVDDMVHAQCQGRIGMYNDISVLANEGRLRRLTGRLLARGYNVYITSDHGNTRCVGIGKYIGAGVDVETKSHRMLVLKDFADKEKLIERFSLIEYPKYYLPKEFNYLICDTDSSLDASAEQVMTHGGMTIDEVVVPFIKIKAVANNG